MALAADPAAGLIEYLRGQLREPALDFAEAPAPVTGGFDTLIFAFRLKSASPDCSRPLVLRLLASRADPRRALRERATQNALVELGYPAPRVLWASADAAPLGGAFLVMERLAGRPLLHARLFKAGAVLADMQARLHDLDAEVLLRALDREGPSLSRATMSFEEYLAQLGTRVSIGGLDGLQRAMDWLTGHRPMEQGRRAICHGDFHPHNILHDGHAVTGVLDWPNALVADPVFDVASTLMILRHTPVELAVAMPLRWVARVARPALLRGYLAGYRRRRHLDLGAMPYYEAASCMRGLVRAAERRPRQGNGVGTPLDTSTFAENLAAHFAGITGVLPTIPPARA